MALSSRSSISPSCESACQEIHAKWNQLKFLGETLASRTPAERQQIKETYRAMYHEDLVEHLHKAWMANSKDEMFDILYMWMLELHERDAMVARDAVERSNVDYKALIEMYTRRKSNQLFFIKQAYLAKFKRHLDQDIISEPPHPCQRILLALAASHKSHHDDVSPHIAKCDAKRLYEAGKGSMGSIDESAILEMFSKRSIPQLKLAFCCYKHIYGHDYTKTLKRENSGEFEDSLRVVVCCIYNPSKYYSKMLHTSLKEADADKRLLTRMMLGSAEVDMEEVKSAFLKRYRKKLEDAICESLPDGDYRDFLVALTNAPISAS
ncbi:annexin A13-like [Phoenix dactylifera]|uniref:Annexin A13-like n=1 Tax=Phoenix dactylifera TaxID=42345 RepID=A0A8B7CEJ4_PHODC|nr:annexin A13-like [Phoenix dactylifera]